jgi:hypothetical protein
MELLPFNEINKNIINRRFRGRPMNELRTLPDQNARSSDLDHFSCSTTLIFRQ